MLYSKVHIDSLGYELAPNVVTSEDLEEKLESLYNTLHLHQGQLEAMTGICERRFWDSDYPMFKGAVKAGQKAIQASNIFPQDIGMLVYGGVCRDNLEPATACAVSDELGLSAETHIFDVSNACLGVLNGIIHVANAIELGHIKAGLVVACESAHQIIQSVIDRLLKTKDMEYFKKTIATLTGGSGAAAVLLTHESISNKGHRIIGGVIRNATEHHKLCRWGPDTGVSASGLNMMETDSIGVLKYGVALGVETFNAFKKELSLNSEQPDKIICHQVGIAYQKTILKSINIPAEKDFSTFQYLGNMGSVSLPITAAIASEREFLIKDNLVGFFGIGSGLNCIMLGIRW